MASAHLTGNAAARNVASHAPLPPRARARDPASSRGQASGTHARPAPHPRAFSPRTTGTLHPRSQRASPCQGKVRVGLLSTGGGTVFQGLQERRERALTRGRHVGHPEAPTGNGENPVTDGNSPSPARRDPGPQTRAPSRLSVPPASSAPLAPGALTLDPNLLLTPRAASTPTLLRPGPSPATTFPGSFQQGEETRVGREKPGVRGVSPRGGGGGARLRVPRGLAL